MKAARFDYAAPADVAGAVAALGAEGAKPMTGGQSLGPMLNLRLARPSLVVNVARLPELRRVEERPDGVLYGAATTHAAIEDGAVPDPTGSVLPAIARGIAYRAVRNRGTIGGSLAHADPAADWPVTLMALGAAVRLRGPAGRRELPVEDFIRGAFETALGPQEIIEAVLVPRLSPNARWAYRKSCRKVGEFADAMCAVLSDSSRGVHRLVIGATEARPVLLADVGGDLVAPERLDARLDAAGLALANPAFDLHRAVMRAALRMLDA